jgi:hypothetical protein
VTFLAFVGALTLSCVVFGGAAWLAVTVDAWRQAARARAAQLGRIESDVRALLAQKRGRK